MDSTRGRISTPMHFWRDHVRHLAPCLCLDVGANYGECFAFGDYPQSRCIAVEANPILLPLLERTRADHPDAERIRIESCLVGDQDDVESTLYYSPTWTGGGSAVKGGAHLKAAKVRMRTLDTIVTAQTDLPDAPLLLKMDVEGYEGHALAGFVELFRRGRAAGIMEFDTSMLTAAGTNAKALFERLADRFAVYLTFPRQRRLRRIAAWDDLACLGKDGHFHCDLAFFSQPDLIAPAWALE